MYWETVLKEVLNKNSSEQFFAFTSVAKYYKSTSSKNKANLIKNFKRGKIVRIYFLNTERKNVYFTKRESECMVHFLRKKTINQTAEELGLSSRTVEFYLKNMRSKVGCASKVELVRLIYNSDFLKSIKFNAEPLI